MGRRIALGLVAAGVYVCVGALTALLGEVPVRPLYDGLAPPAPYRYVSPSPDLADSNEPPLRAVSAVEIGPDGSLARTVSTAEGQMFVVLPDGAIPPRPGEDEGTVRITPLDPSRFAPPPEPLRIDGNAYRVTASYSRSGEPVEPAQPITVVLRYPMHATVTLQLESNGWRRLKTQAAPASLQVFADAQTLGTFAAAGVPARSRVWIAYVAAAAGVAAGAAGFVTGRRRSRKPRRRRPRTRKPR